MTSAEMKQKAKDVLRPRFSQALLLVLIPLILTILNAFASSHLTRSANPSQQVALALQTGHAIDTRALAYQSIASAAISISTSTLLSLIISVLLAMAAFRYLKIFRGEVDSSGFSDAYTPLHDGTFGKILALVVLQTVLLDLLVFVPTAITLVGISLLFSGPVNIGGFLLLAGLILIVVGLVFYVIIGLAWSQSTYVLFDKLTDGSYQGSWDTLKSSAALMRGRKGTYFLYQLSFLGWYILNAISFGLVNIWTMPYVNMSMISFYETLKADDFA